MALLTKTERDDLVQLLAKLPSKEDPTVRSQLTRGIPHDLQNLIVYNGAPIVHFNSIVNTVDDESWDEPYEGNWPILQIVRNSIFYVGKTSPVGSKLQCLLEIFELRAAKWLSVSHLSDVSPQDAQDLERMIDKLVGFHDPAVWRTRMHQRELAVCLVLFENARPKEQGTGFLVGVNLLMTSYHVMEKVLDHQVKAQEVVFRFDYKAYLDRDAEKACLEYHLAEDWYIDASPEGELDYILVKVEGTPGSDLLTTQSGTVQRGWLVPEDHDFQVGEPLFIIQHPDGRLMKFAFDRVKTIYPTRIAYRTNTWFGSSGSPCFTIDWELVALHKGSFKAAIDPEKPNKGVPFSLILQRPKVREYLGS